MVGLRLAIVLVAVGAVAAHEYTLASFGHGIFEKAMKMMSSGMSLYENTDDASRQNSYDEGDHQKFHGRGWHQHGDWHQKMHNKMKEAHACHHSCGKDVVCHAKCPKPGAPFVKACQDFPAIKACHAACKNAECDQCPKFETDWMNEKFASNPERVIRKAEAKCPMLLEKHACHQACTPDDRECHHKCGTPWHLHGEHDHYDHKDWHRRGEHDNDDHEAWHHTDEDQKAWHEKMHKKMKEAYACHHKCGTDVACHTKCSKPWAPFVKACQDFPAIKACHSKCNGVECDRCPKFEKQWLNEEFAKNPERVTQMAEAKCPFIEKAHACHTACAPGDFECHHKCTPFPGSHGSPCHTEKQSEPAPEVSEPILV